MSRLHQNNFSTNLTTATSAGATTSPLNSIPTIAAPFYIAFDATNINSHYEVVDCTSKTATNVNHAATTYDHTAAEEVRMVVPAVELDAISAAIPKAGLINSYLAYTPAGGATATLDTSLYKRHSITMPAGNITIALSNVTAGDTFIIEITQDGVGSRTVTWFTTIRWSGGSAPVLTTTLGKRDVFGFICTGAGTYDGYVIGMTI